VSTEPPGAAPPLRSHAFGLSIESDRSIVGLPAGAGSAGGPATAVALSERGEPGRPAGEEVRTVRRPDGSLVLSVRHDDRGYLLELPGIGAYRVAPDGLLVTCTPAPGLEEWRWQRPVVNQALPLAATLRGFEVLHAGAVALDGRAVAVVGHSGAGKSSTVLNLLLRGATFLTDDALAIERAGDRLLAHPGAAVSNFPRRERELMDGEEAERLGRLIGGEEDAKALLGVDRGDAPLPLAALYFLRRGAPVDRIAFEAVGGDGASMLLGSAYVLSVRSPARLANQLDLCASLAATTPIYDVLLPSTSSARESAAALADHAVAIAGASR
jgi:hypothetical protein